MELYVSYTHHKIGFVARKLGDNYSKVSFGEVYLRIYSGKLSFSATREQSRKHDFRMYIQQFTSPNENFEFDYPNFNALLQFHLKLERCRPHKVAPHPRLLGAVPDCKPMGESFLDYS